MGIQDSRIGSFLLSQLCNDPLVYATYFSEWDFSDLAGRGVWAAGPPPSHTSLNPLTVKHDVFTADHDLLSLVLFSLFQPLACSEGMAVEKSRSLLSLPWMPVQNLRMGTLTHLTLLWLLLVAQRTKVTWLTACKLGAKWNSIFNAG